MTWQSDLHRWDHTSRILAPRHPPDWLWLVLAIVFLAAIVRIASGAPAKGACNIDAKATCAEVHPALPFCGLAAPTSRPTGQAGPGGRNVAIGVKCPTWDDCWQAELRCEATPARNWKPCRRVVRRCFARWERC